MDFGAGAYKFKSHQGRDYIVINSSKLPNKWHIIESKKQSSSLMNRTCKNLYNKQCKLMSFNYTRNTNISAVRPSDK